MPKPVRATNESHLDFPNNSNGDLSPHSIQNPASNSDLRRSKRMIFLLLLFLATVIKIVLSNAKILYSNEEIVHEESTDAIDSKEKSSPAKDLDQNIGSGKGAIAALTTNSTQDMTNLCIGLSSLQYLPDVVLREDKRADVIVFNEGLSEEQKANLTQCTGGNRSIAFPLLKYSFEEFFPPGFDPEKENAKFSKRSKWGYYQMIRFWITFVWEHPALEPYETMMRLDTDACWTASPATSEHNLDVQIPFLPSNMLYHANEEKIEFRLVGKGFGRFVHDYVKKHKIKVKNPGLFANIPAGNTGKVPNFYNNFEILRIAFFRRPEVVQFHRAMTEEEPFGVFRVRWGDALARYAVMAMFASPEEIYRPGTRPNGYEHPCTEGLVVPADFDRGNNAFKWALIFGCFLLFVSVTLFVSRFKTKKQRSK